MTIDVTVRREIPLLTRQADGGGFGTGAEVTRTAYFLGRRIDYVLHVAVYEPPRLLDMVSVAAPMPMHVTYSFEAHPRGTLATIRVRGGPGGLLRLASPLLGRQVRSSLTKDLRDLERRLSERQGDV
ncbi:hypothetical protein [Streptomyces canus]|uniref:hypothetical protein n=1 Tax=Streptomyces canus TaxID=58343 RepID=UPI0037180418